MKTYFKTMQPRMYATSVTDIFLIFEFSSIFNTC